MLVFTHCLDSGKLLQGCLQFAFSVKVNSSEIDALECLFRMCVCVCLLADTAIRNGQTELTFGTRRLIN